MRQRWLRLARLYRGLVARATIVIEAETETGMMAARRRPPRELVDRMGLSRYVILILSLWPAADPDEDGLA